MRRAEERRNASMMISSSIRWSLAGAEVDCSTNTSAPRTFSWISTNTSPSAKRLTIAFASEIFRYLAMSPASIGLELPATSLIAPLLPVIRKSLLRAAFNARSAQRRRDVLGRFGLCLRRHRVRIGTENAEYAGRLRRSARRGQRHLRRRFDIG